MAVKITTVDEATVDNGVKILVHGQAGVGKTVLTTTTGAPTILVSAEAGLLSIKNAPDKIKKNMRIATVRSIDDVEEVYWQVADGAWEADWLMLDSITEIAEQVLAKAGEDSPDPRQAYGVLIERMTKLLKAFRDLENMNVYMSCKQVRFTDDMGVTSYVPMMPGAKLAAQIPYLFDEVFAMRVMQDDQGEDKYILQTHRDFQYEAKDRSGMLNKYEPANLKKILDKIHGREEEKIEPPPEKKTEILPEDKKIVREIGAPKKPKEVKATTTVEEDVETAEKNIKVKK